MHVVISLIWDNYKDAKIEDLARNHNYDSAVNIALSDINTILLENGTNCAAIGLAIPNDNGLYFNDESNLEHQE